MDLDCVTVLGKLGLKAFRMWHFGKRREFFTKNALSRSLHVFSCFDDDDRGDGADGNNYFNYAKGDDGCNDGCSDNNSGGYSNYDDGDIDGDGDHFDSDTMD